MEQRENLKSDRLLFS